MMERILLGVLYLSGWHIFSACLPHQYHYVKEPMSWTEAQTYCRKTYTDLATIGNTEEVNQLKDTVSSFGYESMVWIGLYSKIDWRWSDSYKGPGAEYKNWIGSEPDFLYSNEFCVVSGAINDAWWDDACSLKYPFICNEGTKTDFKYVIVKQAMDWSSAQRYCRENFVDLATVRNDEESLAIQKMVASGWAWIGLFRDPHIYWSDESGFSFQNWFVGSNPLHSWRLACGVADYQASGKWKLLPCERKLPFVCYSVPQTPVMKQVVKLRIKPGDPPVDLNDPAVKADILKKLQDRLKMKGVKEVTLRWREQPDGKVFHKLSEEKKSEL